MLKQPLIPLLFVLAPSVAFSQAQPFWPPAANPITPNVPANESSNGASVKGFSDDAVRNIGGFFKDESPATQVMRIRDRVLIGGASKYTGRRTAPLGGDWLSENFASYFIKNSQAASLSEEKQPRIGFTGGSYIPPGSAAGSTVSIGLAAIAVNRGNGTTARGLYSESAHMTGDGLGASAAIEVQTGNYTATNFVPNAYTRGGAMGIIISPEAGLGYVKGDANMPLDPPTHPSAAGLLVTGGTKGLAYQKFNTGLLFASGGLVRDKNNRATAISFAQGHEQVWNVDAKKKGSVIRGEVTQGAQSTALIFQNTMVKIGGVDERAIALFKDDTAGAGAVNHIALTNARAGIPVKISGVGSDTNVSLDLQTQGTGVTRFLSHGGSGEQLRITPPAEAAVNFTTITGGSPGDPVQISAAGSDTNIDVRLSAKGAGSVVFSGSSFRVATSKTPSSTTASCAIGEHAWDSDFVYVCVAANYWKRAALTSW